MEVYGLIGQRLGHSWSRSWFEEKFRRGAIDACYLNFETDSPADCVTVLLRHYPALRGFNVTIPYKRDIIKLLDSITPEAAAIGAVNAVRVEHRDGRTLLHGANTDARGFAADVSPLLAMSTHVGQYALVLGSGGASAAVAYALREMGLEPIVVSRTPRGDMIGYGDITTGLMAECQMVVNTTPAGMWPDVDSTAPLDSALIEPGQICYDVVYNPDPTRWLEECASRGALTRGGLGMLRAQAEAAWQFWQIG